MSQVMDALRDPAFSYERPWFYNHPMALRCELGIGDEDYMANAVRRAKEIYDILFDGQPDAFFVHHYITDPDENTRETDIQGTLRVARRILTEAMKIQQAYRHEIIRDVAFDREGNPETARINRIICYPDATYDPRKRIRRQIHSWQDFHYSFVSEQNECVYSIYDDRGCDIVFFSKEKFRAFYPRLQPYFLEYDLELMAQRLADCQ